MHGSGGQGIAFDKTILDGIDDGHQFKQACQYFCCVEVIIHVIVQCAEYFKTMLLQIRISGTDVVFCNDELVQLCEGFPDPSQAFLGGLKGFIAKVQRAPVMGLQNEETNGHGRIALCQDLMCTAEEFTELDHIVVALSHLSAVDGDHVVVQPKLRRNLVVAHGALRNLTLVVRKLKVHSTTMDIKFSTQVFVAHGRTLDMPPRETLSPWALPAHDVFWRCMFPQGKIRLVAFLLLRFQFTGCFKLIIQYPAAQNAILHSFCTKIPVVFFNIKID